MNSIQRRGDARRAAGERKDRVQIGGQVGERLRLRRRLLGLTQEQLADDADLSPQQIHKYETGQSQLSAARLIQFGLLLDVDVTWFFDGITDPPDDSKDEMKGPVTEEEYRLLDFFRCIGSSERRQKLIEIASLLGEEG